MAEEIAVKVIARIHTDFPEKFGIPRQSGLIEELKSTIVFEPEFRDANALRGIEEYSHLWLIWEFSEAVRGLAETSGSVYLQRALRSGPIRSGFLR